MRAFRKAAQTALVTSLATSQLMANPVGGTAARGSATFSTQGSTLNIRTSDRAFINWQSFNIGVGETTRFQQPSASSVVWNRINDPNPSQILGNLTANGLVVLQNQAGFYIGGQAAITVGGLLMTTAPTMPSDFMSGGTWQFNGPPPTASIINYGQIEVGRGGSVFLISRQIENHGTITAPGGNVGLHAGQEVLVSQSPDGRGLSARVRLPSGSIDNSGRIVADAGAIAMHAETVNIGGLVQADSVRERNGVIELVASDSINLAPGAMISARGGREGVSPGGNVLVQSAGRYDDAPGATISVAGGAEGGRGGRVEVSANQMSSIQAQIDGSAAAGWLRGRLWIDPLDIILDSTGSPADSGTIGQGDFPGQTLRLNPASFSTFSQITLQATRNITLNRFTLWNQGESSDASSTLTLQAGNNITLSDLSNISLGRNWSLSLVAGADFSSPTAVREGIGGIYLNGNSFLQTQNGSISLFAGKEIIVRTGAIRTIGGGSIFASTLSGDINTGTNPNGYVFSSSGAGYDVSAGSLGGISTAAGGNVTLNAGRDVISFLPTGNSSRNGDPGSGAFGPAPGIVTVTAGRNVYGHFVAANSRREVNGGLVDSTITALQGSVGVFGNLLALSLVSGGWAVNAPNGSIYLQEVRNPNGVFNVRGSAASPTRHLFDYNPRSYVNLTARDAVHLSGTVLPRITSEAVQVIYPPSLSIRAGAGGVLLGNNLTLFPSRYGELNITTTGRGSLQTESPGVGYQLIMSDSGRHQWLQTSDFAFDDHAAYPVQANNLNPVVLDISGDIKDLFIATPKATHITVGGEMDNSTFYGQNLRPTDSTYINVAGRLWNRNDYTFAILQHLLPLIRINPNLPPDYFQVLAEAVTSTGQLLFPGGSPFVYNPATGRIGFRGRMSSDLEQLLSSPLQVRSYGPDGQPIRDLQGNYVTRPATFALSSTVIHDLFQRSQDVPERSASGYQISGPGHFSIRAASLDLGVTAGIISEGPVLNPALARLPSFRTGSDISIELTHGDLTMFSSTISSLFGGPISIYTEGNVNVGSAELRGDSDYPRGIYTVGQSDISLIARGNIDVQGSRIAAYNGGDILIRSLLGDVNAGDGGVGQVRLSEVFVDPITRQVIVRNQPIAGSGIMATTMPDAPAGQTVGNIRIETPRGDIIASNGGIVQDALNGNRSLGPTVTLTAGTRDSAGNIIYHGNIDASGSGVIGVNTFLNAAGNISGLVVASGNATINAAANVSGTFFAAGTANFNAGGNVQGIVIAGQGINASGGSFNATAFSQNVSVGGKQGDSALASSASAGSTSQAAAQSASQSTESTVAQAKVPGSDDSDLKKKAQAPLLRRMPRVTVILPPA